MSVIINKKHMCVVTVSVVLAFVLCAFRIYLLRNYVEPETGYYVPGTNLGTIFGVAFLLVLAVIAVGAKYSKVKIPESLSSESTAVVFSSSLCGFLFVTVLVCGVYQFVTLKNTGAFRAVELLVCIPCVFSFYCICVKENRERNIKNLVFALCPALFYGVRTIHMFTDTHTQINASQRSLSLVMLCSMMLLFIQEAYFLIPKHEKAESDKEKKSVAFKYAAITLIVMTLALTAALPYIAVSAFWMFESDFLVMDVLDLCIGVYALTRAAALCRQ